MKKRFSIRLVLPMIFALGVSAVAQEKQSPELGRVGVDMNQQRSLSLRDAL